MNHIKLSLITLGLVSLLGACTSQTTTTAPVDDQPAVAEPPAESSGNVEEDFTDIDAELDGLDAQEDFPPFDEDSF